MTSTHIEADQVYVACRPRDLGRRIRIVSYTPGHDTAQIVDADTGARPRQISVWKLHDSATTRYGKPRTTGYVRETTAPEPAPAQPWLVLRDRHSRLWPWQWVCTATVGRPQQTPATCPDRGPARTEDHARQAAERHAKSAHRYTAPEA
ncbi:hypothetical protein [Streptomyces syringium]|uniref:hypothetical protein n=1 Tax=Streptomyces syringium TaxID=76729 RepID=UPI00340B4632